MNKEKYFDEIKEYKLLAKHEVGQNFLVDMDEAANIVSLAALTPSDNVLEIGSGAGSLSFFIAEAGTPATLIDIDEGLVTKLKNDFVEKPQVKVEQANIMRYDVSSFSKVIGNLPYYITSGIIARLALNMAPHSLAVLMVQKEVFPRLNAKVGQDGYGPLPILLSYRGTLKKERLVPRTAFLPSPHVDSLVFTYCLNDKPLEEATALYKLTSRLFLHRRKTILNNLSAYLNDGEKAKAVLEKTGIALTSRPEELSVLDYLKLLSQLH